MMKWIGMTAALVLMVGLSACSGGDTAPAPDESTPAPETEADTTASEGSDTTKAMSPVVAAVATPDAAAPVLAVLEAETVGVACGVCIYGMEGEGCPVAATVGDETYFIQFADGVEFDTHGKGLCKADTTAQAKVTGEVKDGVLVLSSLDLLSD